MAQRRSKNIDPSIKNPAKYLWPFDNWEEMTGEEYLKYRRHAQAFYVENTSTSDLHFYVRKWMKLRSYNKDDIESVVSNSKLSSLVGVLCKLRTTGCPSFNEKENEHWKSLPGTVGELRPLDEDIRVRINALIEPKKEKEKETKVVVSVRDRMIEQMDPLISSIEGAIDDIHDKVIKHKEFDPYHMMITYEHKVKPAHAKIVQEHFSRIYGEIKELVEGNDDQLKEGYSYLTAKGKKDLLKIYESINVACDMLIQKGKTQRKPRKPKEISKEKLVGKVQYKELDTDFGVASISPISIINAKELWVFNTKYRKLTRYIVDEYAQGFSIKGTTIQGFDTTRSESKTLRKPVEQLAELMKSNKVARRKFMGGIKSKASVPNGRLNKDTILLMADHTTARP